MLHTYIDRSATYDTLIRSATYLQDIKTNFDVNELFAVYFICMVDVK